MYTQYFSLKQPPFSIAPDPRYLFMSERHREALAHLLYGIGSGGGFVLLTGEIGAGKTTVCRCFIEQVPSNCRLAYIFNPKLTVAELLLSVCEEFGIALPSEPAGVKGFIDAINRYLLESHAQGLNNVLVIDEAQNLAASVLEQLRLLTNLETSERKLLQIILIGQPELRAMLAAPEMEQLAQRVIARYHLGPLSEAETGSYIAHRMAVAGATANNPFPARLTVLIHRLTQGVPRRINLLCDRALLGAYVEGGRDVTRAILMRAAAEVFEGAAQAPARKARWPIAAALAGVALSAAAAWQLIPAKAPAPVALQPAVPKPRSAPPAPLTPLTLAAEQDALRELAGLWKQPLGDGDACELARKAGLRCHQGKGGLYELRLLDRPAVIALHEGASTGYALLVALDDSSVTLRADGRTQRLPLALLATRFDGSFTTLWRMPRSFRDQVAAGGQGPEVDWIAARLAQLDGEVAPAGGQRLDAAMQDRLRAFQAGQHLKADGVAGPRTFMRLNQLTGEGEPRLLAAAGAK